MATYMDVAQQGLRDYALTVITEGLGYGTTGSEKYQAAQVAAAAWDAMVDALVQAGADLTVMEGWLFTEVEEPAFTVTFPLYDEPWGVDPDLGQGGVINVPRGRGEEFGDALVADALDRQLEERFGAMADRISAEIVGALREAAKVLRKGESL